MKDEGRMIRQRQKNS